MQGQFATGPPLGRPARSEEPAAGGQAQQSQPASAERAARRADRALRRVEELRPFVRVWVQREARARDRAALRLQRWWRAGDSVRRAANEAKAGEKAAQLRAAVGAPGGPRGIAARGWLRRTGMGTGSGASSPRLFPLMSDLQWWPLRVDRGRRRLPPAGSRALARLDAAVRLQALWRGVRARRALGRLLAFSARAVPVQAAVRGRLARRGWRGAGTRASIGAGGLRRDRGTEVGVAGGEGARLSLVQRAGAVASARGITALRCARLEQENRGLEARVCSLEDALARRDEAMRVMWAEVQRLSAALDGDGDGDG